MSDSGPVPASTVSDPKPTPIQFPTGTFLPPDTHFEHVHVDLVGPLPPSQDFTYLLTCVDRFTHWPETILLTTYFIMLHRAVYTHATRD